MVKHIVFWKLKPQAENGSAQQNAAIIKRDLESLVGVVPGLVSAKVYAGFSPDYDLCLYSEVEDRRALAVYQEHPAHVKARDFILKVVEGRAAFDCEV